MLQEMRSSSRFVSRRVDVGSTHPGDFAGMRNESNYAVETIGLPLAGCECICCSE